MAAGEISLVLLRVFALLGGDLDNGALCGCRRRPHFRNFINKATRSRRIHEGRKLQDFVVNRENESKHCFKAGSHCNAF